MEAVNGKSIGQRMRKGERFSSREILKTGIALSGILCYLHAQNPPVFYRDLKPDNVMITERGEIYLVDFGAAGTEETGVEVRYGTRGYAAPEQYDGKCDARSDLYALGALLAAMAKHAKKRQKRGLWRVMEKCMQKKPEERYASAGEVKKALRRLERKRKGRKTLRIFAVFAFLTGGAAAVASRMPWGQFPAADEWEEQGDLWFCGNPVEEGSLPNYQKAREAFLKADHLSQAGRVEQELVEYCLADDAAREKMQMEPLLAEFYDDTQQEPEKEKPDYIVPEVEAIATQTLMELEKEGFDKACVDKYLAMFEEITNDVQGVRYVKEKLEGVLDPEYADGLELIMNSVDAVKAADFKIAFDPTLVRGMSYYTGPIFEISMDEFGGSVGGGGRYDEMIGKFTGNNTCACGFSIGFERIIMLLMERGFQVPQIGTKKALLIEKNMPAEGMMKVLKQAEEDRKNGSVVTIAVMKKNKKFQKEQLKEEGYEEIVEFFADRM